MSMTISGDTGLAFPDASTQAVSATGLGYQTSAQVTTAINSLSLGIGQTWQTVTRTSGVTYTNSTGKPILVNVITQVNNTPGTGATITVGGVLVSSTLGFAGGIGMAMNVTQSAIIPTGATYVIAGNFADTAIELR
jgi:hypothetical protein